MLVDLSKEELRILCKFISHNAVHKEIDPIYDKLKNISNACECKEQEKQRDTYNKINS